MKLTINEIVELLPHRYPFLFVDAVESIEPGKSIIAYKNTTFNEPQFQGHFPGNPVFPGVYIIEAMAQTSGILAFVTEGTKAEKGSIYMFVGADKARFRKQVIPGDKICFESEIVSVKRDIWKFSCQATVEGQRVASADILCARRKL